MPDFAAGGWSSRASPFPRLPGGESSARAGTANPATPTQAAANNTTRRMDSYFPSLRPNGGALCHRTGWSIPGWSGKYPRVLCAAVLGGVDDQRARVEGDAGEAAREHARLAAF